MDGRFELDDPDVMKLFEEHSWSWTDNPFVGTRELAGLKVMLMLISNWDNKDQRDVARGSNTAIYVTRVSRWKREAQYLIVDWGGSMGKLGRQPSSRAAAGTPAGFAAQTPQFVTGVTNGYVQFGYTGQRTGDARASITRGRRPLAVPVSGPDHRRSAARGADASAARRPRKSSSFTASLRSRIEQLRAI